MLLVTGGAGFIGSQLAKKLSAADEVLVFDDLSEGDLSNLDGVKHGFLKGDLKKTLDVEKISSGVSTIYHFAADPDVRSSHVNPTKSFENNVVATFNLLEFARSHDVENFVLASSSVVYGDAKTIPTPEDAPLIPISNYGASKIACEAYVESYSSSYGIKATIIRYANVFGSPSKHGVMFDFYKKLKVDPSKLDILGDGFQKKSYVYVDDAVDATILATEKQSSKCEVFNVGSSEVLTVREIADLLARELGLSPKYAFSGGKRGWVGDVSEMLLSTDKVESLGWKPKFDFIDGLKNYAEWLKCTV